MVCSVNAFLSTWPTGNRKSEGSRSWRAPLWATLEAPCTNTPGRREMGVELPLIKHQPPYQHRWGMVVVVLGLGGKKKPKVSVSFHSLCTYMGRAHRRPFRCNNWLVYRGENKKGHFFANSRFWLSILWALLHTRWLFFSLCLICTNAMLE